MMRSPAADLVRRKGEWLFRVRIDVLGYRF
jgi:hypothetical protein